MKEILVDRLIPLLALIVLPLSASKQTPIETKWLRSLCGSRGCSPSPPYIKHSPDRWFGRARLLPSRHAGSIETI